MVFPDVQDMFLNGLLLDRSHPSGFPVFFFPNGLLFQMASNRCAIMFPFPPIFWIFCLRPIFVAKKKHFVFWGNFFLWRLGAFGAKEIKSHQYFCDFDFDAVAGFISKTKKKFLGLSSLTHLVLRAGNWELPTPLFPGGFVCKKIGCGICG